MVSANRRALAKVNLRRAILDAAKELFATEDFQAVSLRKIAEKIEYSPTAIYMHFKDKNEILLELITEGFSILIERLEPLREVANPLDRLRQGGHIYLEFAFSQPHYYRLMFQLQDRLFSEEVMPKCEKGQEAFGFVRQTVAQAIAMGLIRDDVPEPIVSHAVLATMHGVASMYLSGHLHMLPEEMHREFFEYMIESTVRGIGG